MQWSDYTIGPVMDLECLKLLLASVLFRRYKLIDHQLTHSKWHLTLLHLHRGVALNHESNQGRTE